MGQTPVEPGLREEADPVLSSDLRTKVNSHFESGLSKQGGGTIRGE